MPICPAHPRGSRSPAAAPRFSGREVAALYLAVSGYVAIDVSVFHLLSGWLTVVLEAVELAPIVGGVVAFCAAGTGRGLRLSRLPRIVVVPMIATAIQLQMLAFAEAYRVFALA